MWKGTLGDRCLSLGLFSFLVVLGGGRVEGHAGTKKERSCATF